MSERTERRPDSPVGEGDDEAVIGLLSTLNRYLPLWIGLAMVGGLLLGRLVPHLDDWLDAYPYDRFANVVCALEEPWKSLMNCQI